MAKNDNYMYGQFLITPFSWRSIITADVIHTLLEYQITTVTDRKQPVKQSGYLELINSK